MLEALLRLDGRRVVPSGTFGREWYVHSQNRYLSWSVDSEAVLGAIDAAVFGFAGELLGDAQLMVAFGAMATAASSIQGPCQRAHTSLSRRTRLVHSTTSMEAGRRWNGPGPGTGSCAKCVSAPASKMAPLAL
jgi:hypothetical protein